LVNIASTVSRNVVLPFLAEFSAGTITEEMRLTVEVVDKHNEDKGDERAAKRQGTELHTRCLAFIAHPAPLEHVAHQKIRLRLLQTSLLNAIVHVRVIGIVARHRTREGRAPIALLDDVPRDPRHVSGDTLGCQRGKSPRWLCAPCGSQVWTGGREAACA